MRKSFLLNRLIYYPLVRKFKELVLSIKLLKKSLGMEKHFRHRSICIVHWNRNNVVRSLPFTPKNIELAIRALRSFYKLH
jgi:hypothetical protein